MLLTIKTKPLALKLTKRHKAAELFSLLIIILASSFPATATPIFGVGLPPPDGLNLLLTVNSSWRDDGSASVFASAELNNSGEVMHQGELRTALVAINGKIDFNHVSVHFSPEPSSPYPEANGAGFVAIPNIKIAPGQTLTFPFLLALPPGSKRDDLPLQLIVFLRDGSPDAARWLVRNAKFVPGTGERSVRSKQ